MTMTSRVAAKRKTRSPELERLIRTLEMVATDLPRILREEKAVAFSRLDSVDAFEAHMRRFSQIPGQLEELSRTIGVSLQVEGATDHLSRIFRAISTSRGVVPPETAHEKPAVTPAEPAASPPSRGGDPLIADVILSQEAITSLSGPVIARVDPNTGDITRAESPGLNGFHPIDLNLQKVREALVPGGEICGRSMYESSRVRLVTARASGEGPWRFQFRRGSLEWAAQGEESGLRGVAALICADRGYIQVPATLLLERGRSHLMRSTKGNPILRPSVAVYGAEAILHPGAMAKTRPGEATKHGFVEF